ncbi:MAG: DUF4139 domain-containing protein [Desulfovibrionaceae bacterium]|nr:DUF4139 domain-containing protein [Desulfovibrionaceae bacterium]
MKKKALCTLIASITLLSLYTSGYSASMEQSKPMVPTTAIVSRQNATLIAKESVRISKGTFSVVLPSSFVQDSFVLQTEGMDIMTTEVKLTPIQIKDIPLVQTRADLLKKIEQLTTKMNAIDARVKVLSSSQQVFTSAKDISTLDSALGSRFEYLYNQKNQLKQQQDATKQELQIVERNLIESTGSVEPSYVVVTVSLVDKNINGEYPIVYSYIAGSIGWNPLYQVDADITKKTVRAKFNVELWQRTALPWSGTSVILTTATPTSSPEPTQLPSWNVGINKPQPQAKVMMARSGIQTFELTDPDAPIVEVVSNAMQWSLGKQNVVAGETKIITISTTMFDADFMYTLRPYVANEAFFTAYLKSNKQPTLPMGKASFSVVGIGVGQGTFSYTPNDTNKVYFGKDPLVTGTMELQKDTLVVTKKDQVKTYEWKIKVQNRRKNSVHVLVQDIKPETSSPQIAISCEGSSPQPQITAEYVEWDIPSLRPQKVETINYSVTMTAPLDVEIVSPR